MSRETVVIEDGSVPRHRCLRTNVARATTRLPQASGPRVRGALPRKLLTITTLCLVACASPRSADPSSPEADLGALGSNEATGSFSAVLPEAAFVSKDELTYEVRLLGVSDPSHFRARVGVLGEVRDDSAFIYTVTSALGVQVLRSSAVYLHAQIDWLSKDPPNEDVRFVTGPADFLKTGLAAACEFTVNARTPSASVDEPAVEPPTADLMRDLYAVLLALFQTLRGVPEIEAVVTKALDRPGLWSFVTHAGLDVTIRNEMGDITRAPEGTFRNVVGDQPVYLLPIILEANGREALRCRLWVTHPGRPLTICGGVLAIEAVSPSDPDRRAEVRIIASHLSDTAPDPRE